MGGRNTAPRLPKLATPKLRALVGRDRLTCRQEGDHRYLYHRSGRRPLVGVVPDSKYPGMFRVRYPNGKSSDFVDLTRAKDAAQVICLPVLNSAAQERTVSAHLREKLLRLLMCRAPFGRHFEQASR